MPLPKVSFLVPVHNGMPYLPAALASLRAQTFRDFEIVLIDDGSTDDTPRFVRATADSTLVYHRLNKVGLVAALNHGLRVARGRLVARMDADDIATPDRLEKQVAHLERRPTCVACSCNFERIDSQGRPYEQVDRPLTDDAARWVMLFRPPLLHPGALYIREVVLGVGGYRPEYDVAEDYDLWVRLSRVGQLNNLPERLMQYRCHGGSVSSLKQQRQFGQAAQIAADYARAAFQIEDGEAVRGLWTLAAGGNDGGGVPVRRVLRVYQAVRARFLDCRTPDRPDLLQWISTYDRWLRWRCGDAARENLWRPMAAWRWLRAGRRFDPQAAPIARRLGRRLWDSFRPRKSVMAKPAQ